MSPLPAEAGRAAEAFVAGRLERQGYAIIDRNWRIRAGEVDIVALHEGMLVFVEVRARLAGGVVQAEESVDARKLARVLATAEAWIAAHPDFEDTVWRVDLVALSIDRRGTVQRYLHLHDLTLE